MALPRTAREFFYWTTVLVLLLMGYFQVYLSQRYFRRLAEYALSRPIGLPGTTLPSPLKPVLVVVVSSSPRSGSSFLGELLSSPENASFFFEPFWYYQNIINMNKSGVQVDRDLYNLLTCRFESLPPMFSKRQQRNFIWRKPRQRKDATRRQLTSNCLKASVRVAKTIRPRLRDVLPLLQHEGLNMHVLHLVRDPRGIMNSVLSAGKMWPEWRRNAEIVCDGIRDDIRASRNVTSARFTVVRYEDVVSHPMEEARRLFGLLRLPVTSEVLKFIDSHVRIRTSKVEPGSDQKNKDKNGKQQTSGGDIGRAGGDAKTGRRSDAGSDDTVDDKGKSDSDKERGEEKSSDPERQVSAGAGWNDAERVRATGPSQEGGSDNTDATTTTRQRRSADVKKYDNRSRRLNHPPGKTSVLASAARRQKIQPEPSNIATRRRHRATTDSNGAAGRKPLKTPVRPPRFRRVSWAEFEKIKKQKVAKSAPGQRYHGTVRDAQFDQLHWIKELSPADREMVERACGDVLQALGYPLVYPEERQKGQTTAERPEDA